MNIATDSVTWKIHNITLAVNTSADDTEILSLHENFAATISNLQKAVDEVAGGTRDWKIKLNNSKTTLIEFSLPSHYYIPHHIQTEKQLRKLVMLNTAKSISIKNSSGKRT